jgi:hypothetical protein
MGYIKILFVVGHVEIHPVAYLDPFYIVRGEVAAYGGQVYMYIFAFTFYPCITRGFNPIGVVVLIQSLNLLGIGP